MNSPNYEAGVKPHRLVCTQWITCKARQLSPLGYSIRVAVKYPLQIDLRTCLPAELVTEPLTDNPCYDPVLPLDLVALHLFRIFVRYHLRRPALQVVFRVLQTFQL